MMIHYNIQKMMSWRFNKVYRSRHHGGLQETSEDVHEISLSIEDCHELVQINLGPNVGDITTECKPPRRGWFTINYIEAHEDQEDGALQMKL